MTESTESNAEYDYEITISGNSRLRGDDKHPLISMETLGFYVQNGEKYPMGAINILGFLKFAEDEILQNNLAQAEKANAQVRTEEINRQAQENVNRVIAEQQLDLEKYKQLPWIKKIFRVRPGVVNGWQLYKDEVRFLENLS